MGLPTPSPAQLAALTALKAVALAGVSAGPIKEAAIQSALTAQQEVEDFQKETFDSLNDEIIRRYEVERRWLDGQDIVAPILEADVLTFAAADESSRIWNGGDFGPLRINEFDGLPLSVLEAEPEQDQFSPQDVVLDYLQNGITSVNLTNGVMVQAMTSASVDGEVESDNAGELADNDFIVLNNATDSAIVQVTNVVEAGAGPYQYTFDIIKFIAEPVGTIAIADNAGIENFGGFTNAERTTKTATDLFFQNVLDGLLIDLEFVFNLRKTALQNQKNELLNNENDNLPASAEANVDASISAIDGFLGVTPPTTIDISDIGIAAIDAEKVTRSAQVTQRILDIASEIAFGVDNSNSYYNLRFNTSEGRCRLNNGSIVLLSDLTQALSAIQAGTGEASDLADRYDALIP